MRKTTIGPDEQGRHPFKGGRVDTIHGAAVHHTNRRIDEHAKTRERAAHAFTGPDGVTRRSTRGFAAAHVEDGQSFHPLPALDVQPRHGGAPKGSPVHVHGSMHHVTDGTFNAGVSKTEAAAALTGYTLPTDPPVVVGKKLTPAPVAWGNKSVGAEQHDASGAQARKILQDGYAASGPDHPARLGILPDATTETTDSGKAPSLWPAKAGS